MCKRRIGLVFLVLLLACGMVAQADVGDGLKGLWEFSNADDLTAAKVGNDLVLAGDGVHTAMAGVGAGDGAVSIGVGSYYECTAGIAANGGGSTVNQYTLLFDFKYPSSSVGQYMCFFQTDTTNSNDGDYFISPSEDWGVASISYASNSGGKFSVPDTWYRVILSVDQGSGNQFFGLYIDGVLIHTHGNSGTDGRHSLYADPAVNVLLFADENGEDPEIHCSTVAIWNRSLTAEEIALLGGAGDTIVLFGPSSDPNPEDGATDIPRDVVLTWTAGEYAATHDIYLGTSFADVNTAERADSLGVLLSQGQGDAAYDPDGLLDFGQTYYWRIDEVNAVPTTIFRGEVWSFTAEPFAYPVSNITATSNAIPEGDVGPENTIDGSGLNEMDQHSVDAPDMFLGKPNGDEPFTIQYEFDAVYKLHEMLVWNYNVAFELMLGFGFKDTTVEYSVDGAEWTALPAVEFAQATAQPDYVANTTVAFDGVAAKYVRLTVNSSYDIGMLPEPQYGLSEVRFMYIPAQARESQPDDGGADVLVTTDLSWRAGREAVSHEVYLGTDPNALTLADTTSDTSYAPSTLNLGTTYYWKVDEVNEADAISVWEGRLWSFSTQAFFVVDDFESYNDDDNLIYETWLDGWVNGTGSTVGYLQAPFAETTIVNSGGQAMPLFYDNAEAATSEADFELSQDWTTNGVQSLSLYFHGDPANTGGQLYLKINNTKLVYDYLANAVQKSQWIAWTVDLASVGANLTSVTNLTIGVEGAGVSGVVYVDDIRLYPQAVEFIEAVPPTDDDASLMGLWKLDDASGTTAADSSGNNRNGMLQGDPQWVGAGVKGGALELDGVDDYVVLDTISYGDAGSADFSVSLWVRTDGWDSDAAMISNKDWDSGINPGWAIAGGGGNNGSWQWNYSDGQTRADFDPSVDVARIATGEWCHLCVTHDRDGLARFYYGGQLIGESDISAMTDSLDDGLPTVLGTDGAEGTVWAYWFAGAFDEVRIYDRLLSEAEVLGLAGVTGAVPKPF